jgi:hypothetical protein
MLCGLEGCGRIISRPLWSNIWIRTDDRGWWHDLIFNALWIGTDVRDCSHDLNWSAMWTEMYVPWSFYDKFEVIYGLEHVIKDDVMT